MAKLVQADLGASPPDEDGLKPYIDREVHPVLKSVRRTVNDLVGVSFDPVVDDTVSDESKTIDEIELNEDELITITMNARGAAGPGDWVFKRQEITFIRSDGLLQVILIDLDTIPVYAGPETSMSTATCELIVEDDKIRAKATGELDKPIHWTVYLRKLVAFEREKR